MISFKLEKVKDDRTGTEIDTLIKYTETPDGYGPPVQSSETWCNVIELDQLFDACSKRWGNNLDVNKLVTAVTECEFD